MTHHVAYHLMTLLLSGAAAAFERIREMHHGESLVLACCGVLLLALSAVLRRTFAPPPSFAPAVGKVASTPAESSVSRRAS